jgi:type I restriction enzyme S subunit
MELKPGYKQTEIGVIPEDWETRLLGEGIKLLSGHHVLARHFNTDANGVPYITGPADFPEGVIRHTKFTTKPGTICRESDVLVTVKGSGSGTLVLSDSEYCISRQLMAIRVTEWNTRYIYFLLSRDVSLFGAAATGLIPGLSRTDILNKLIPLPPIKAEQEAIAEALSDTDALIESLEQLITKKRQIKQGAMQELLTGKMRLPGFQVKSGYKKTDLGVIPEDWDVVPMGQVSECLIGLTYSPLNVQDFGTLVLRSSNVQNGRLAFDDNVFVDMEIPARAIIRENDILICVRNGSRQLIGKCALIDDKTAGSAFGAFMSVLRSDSAKFLFFQFQSNILKCQIDEVMGATINQITNKDMAVFKVIWPPTKTEQTAIATILSDMDAEIAALETRLAKTRSLKQGMMHNLLTGKIRLL